MLLEAVDHLQRLVLMARGFRSRHVRTSVGRVHVFDAPGHGDGPPVVVQHGISAASTHFASVLPRLRAHARRVVACDLPGHGFSDVPAAGLNAETLSAGLLDALDHVVEEPVVFFGNSLGGLAAIRYAQQRPDRVRALVLCSPGGAGCYADDASLRAFLDAFRMESLSQAAAFADRLHASPPWYRWLIAGGVRRGFMRPEMQQLVGGIRVEDLLTAEELGALRIPVTVVWGKRESLLPPEQREFYRAHLPANARFVEPDDFGHCPNLDRPGALAATIAEVVREHAGRMAAARVSWREVQLADVEPTEDQSEGRS